MNLQRYVAAKLLPWHSESNVTRCLHSDISKLAALPRNTSPGRGAGTEPSPPLRRDPSHCRFKHQGAGIGSCFGGTEHWWPSHKAATAEEVAGAAGCLRCPGLGPQPLEPRAGAAAAPPLPHQRLFLAPGDVVSL